MCKRVKVPSYTRLARRKPRAWLHPLRHTFVRAYTARHSLHAFTVPSPAGGISKPVFVAVIHLCEIMFHGSNAVLPEPFVPKFSWSIFLLAFSPAGRAQAGASSTLPGALPFHLLACPLIPELGHSESRSSRTGCRGGARCGTQRVRRAR
jgi:hypothetical protein